MTTHLYDELQPGELRPCPDPVPGWRLVLVREDGVLGGDFDVRPDTLESFPARCYHPDRSRAGAPPFALSHNIDCRCGYRICRGLPTLAAYLWAARHIYGSRKDFPFAWLALLEVEGFETVAYREERGGDGPGVLRFSRYRATGRVLLPETWDGAELDQDLLDRVAETYSALSVERIPHIWITELPR